jgi:hypothetical protein
MGMARANPATKTIVVRIRNNGISLSSRDWIQRIKPPNP